ncbi:MAG: putative zinc-binding metallopeptidase [Gemmatimonadetes bacterium]|nr:putative zinc-binding metallopeptidase [Gemmatimonadota bacterium]
MPDTPLPPSTPTAQGRRKSPVWARWSDEKLLDLRICDLGVTIEGTQLERRIAELNHELDARGIRFRPHFWLSEEWFTPDDVPGVAIPFYLAHARLARLEMSQMLEVEGGTKAWCMRILRHEIGHAIDHAYQLHRKRRRQKLFGSSSVEYPEYYAPKPYSKSFVLHLDSWYAQSHPDEDFAETFAVWLTPHSQWRKRYADWPIALKKLEYMDELMRETSQREPVVTSQAVVDPVSRIRKTLRQHYRRKRRHYGLDYPSFYDSDLRKLFSDSEEFAQNMPAAQFLKRNRREVRRLVGRWTAIYQYTIDQVLEDMIARCTELNLRLRGSEERTRMDFSVLLTVQAMNYLHSGRHRLAL